MDPTEHVAPPVTSPRAILIVGGYGTFGARTARLLADLDGLRITIAGRSLAKAEACVAALQRRLGPRCWATLDAAAFDRNAPQAVIERLMRDRAIDLVVDASGPFQDYGGAGAPAGATRYGIVEACLAAGVSYVDLADASAFVAGIDAYDVRAKQAAIFVISGASSFPVLTAAAARAMSGDLATIDSVSGGIAPSPHARVGRNVIAAILTYAGQPIRRYENGAVVTEPGILDGRRKTIAIAGLDPLPRTRFTLFDVPDLAALPAAGLGRSVWMGAGPTPAILHRALNGFSWLVSKGWLASLRPMVGLVHLATSTLRWGRHRGGMFVTLRGRGEEAGSVQRTWSLIAEGDDGPDIPTMAVVGLVRRMREGRCPPPGARSAVDALELADYEKIFAERRIRTAITTDAPLYEAALGAACASLPASIRAMHAPHVRLAAGRADVERGRGLLARMAAACLGLPKAGRDIPVSVVFDRDSEDGREIWTRRFAGRSMRSQQSLGPLDGATGRRLIAERFGPVTALLQCEAGGGELRLTPVGWRLLGIPMPGALGPSGHGIERDVEGVFTFDVEIGHPLTGLIARYRGTLEPV